MKIKDFEAGIILKRDDKFYELIEVRKKLLSHHSDWLWVLANTKDRAGSVQYFTLEELNLSLDEFNGQLDKKMMYPIHYVSSNKKCLVMI